MGQGRLVDSNHSKEWPQRLKEVAAKQLESKTWQPVLIEMQQVDSANQLDKLLATRPVHRIIDSYDEQYAELMISHHPQLYRAPAELKSKSLQEHLATHYDGRESWQLGTWVYFPWTCNLVHVLEKKDFLESRTIRNKDLITAEEQDMYANFAVGCAGMSVGSNVALALAITGGSQQLKIADSAVISASNLNRIVAGIADVGESKSKVVARKLHEMNPYMTIKCIDENISSENIHQFFEESWQLQAVVDEIDDLKTKILLRVEARKRRLPVIMATDLGDDVMLDVERFDLDGNLPLFHGLVKDIELLLDKEVGGEEWLKYAMQIIGPNNISLRMQQSLLAIGSKLVTQPQLGSTAIMSGAIAAYAVRQIAIGNPLASGRTMISLEKHLRQDVNTRKYKRELRAHTKQLKQALGII